MNILSPLRYFGQREVVLTDLLNIITPSTKINCFYDLFSGSGSISFAVMQHDLAHHYILNDSLPHLKILWSFIKGCPQLVINQFNQVYRRYNENYSKTSEYYQLLLNEFNDSNNLEMNIGLFVFLINYSKNNIPIFRSNKKLACQVCENLIHPLPSEDSWFTQRVNNLNQLFIDKDLSFNSGDFLTYLSHATENDFVMLDPPYPKQSEEIYFNLKSSKLLKKELENAILTLNAKGTPFLLLYGAGDLEKEFRFDSNRLEVEHLVRLSSHPLLGKFPEHMYVSKKINIRKLPSHIKYYSDVCNLA